MKKVKLDWDKVLRIHNQTTKNRTGFVIRDKRYGKMLETSKRIQPEKSVITDKGYALLRENEGNIRVQELIAPTKEEISKLIIQIEEKTAKTVVDKTVMDKRTVETYQSHGYMILRDSYDLLMSKPLTDVTFAEAYGKKILRHQCRLILSAASSMHVDIQELRFFRARMTICLQKATQRTLYSQPYHPVSYLTFQPLTHLEVSFLNL